MTLILYCLAVAVCSLAGGYLPLSKRITHVNLQVYLSLSSGAMLGAAFFHMLPHSAELAPRQFGLWMALGVIGLYMIERFLSPHSHDTNGATMNIHDDEAGHHHDHAHEHRQLSLDYPAAPQVAGWSAVAGLSIHTLLGGVALGSAVLAAGTRELGLAVFIATVLHKPADALTISTLLIKGGTSKKRAVIVQCCFACLIPLGALIYSLGHSAVHLESTFTGCVLAFSAGTFVCIALSDMLPEVQFHSHDRGRLFLAVILGAGLMWAASLIESDHGLAGEIGQVSTNSPGALINK